MRSALDAGASPQAGPLVEGMPEAPDPGSCASLGSMRPGDGVRSRVGRSHPPKSDAGEGVYPAACAAASRPLYGILGNAALNAPVVGIRAVKVVRYTTPDLAGSRTTALVGLGGVPGNAGASSYVSANASYARGDAHATSAYLSGKYASRARAAQNQRIGFVYALNPLVRAYLPYAGVCA